MLAYYRDDAGINDIGIHVIRRIKVKMNKLEHHVVLKLFALDRLTQTESPKVKVHIESASSFSTVKKSCLYIS